MERCKYPGNSEGLLDHINGAMHIMQHAINRTIVVVNGRTNSLKVYPHNSEPITDDTIVILKFGCSFSGTKLG